MITSTLLEILGERRICMHTPTFIGLRNRILANIESGYREQIDRVTDLQALVKFSAGVPAVVTDFVGDARIIGYYNDLRETDTIVNVVRLTGAMTRGGGDCSYGSIELRDKMIAAANIKQTVAHIIYGRTPGGMASTLRDFRAAINYCHSKGQKVYFYCDGDVASGGAFTACMTDGIYASNPDDEIGSLGMYCAFFTLQDGAKHSVTSEQYHEYYASASKDKNAWYRKAAEGDMSLIEKEINLELAQLLANLRKDRPQVKEEFLTGAMYRMGDVKGGLIDGFCSLLELAKMALDEWKKRGGTPLPPKETAAPVKTASGAKSENEKNDNHLITETMNKNYVSIAQFIGEQPMESDNEGVLSLQPYQADELEKVLKDFVGVRERLAAENTELKEQVQSLSEQLASSQSELKEVKDTVSALDGSAKNAEELAEAQKTTISELESRIAELESGLKTSEEARLQAEQEVSAQKEQIAGHEQTIADLRAEVEELNVGENPVDGKGEGIRNNGKNLSAPKLESAPVWDPALSPTENVRRFEEYKKRLASFANGH